MLLDDKTAKFYGKYLETTEKSGVFHCKEPNNVPEKDKKRLLSDDEDYVFLYGYHMIDNYEELK